MSLADIIGGIGGLFDPSSSTRSAKQAGAAIQSGITGAGNALTQGFNTGIGTEQTSLQDALKALMSGPNRRLKEPLRQAWLPGRPLQVNQEASYHCTLEP